MITILYTIFTLFFVRGLFALFEGGIWALSFGSMIFSILGLFFLHNKYENKYVSFALIPLLLIFMIGH
jgi:hypothetical protein